MQGKNKFYFFMLVLFFCGSIVLTSVSELHRHRKLENRKEVDMKQIVRALHGDILAQNGFRDGHFKTPDFVPTRGPGKYLHSEDKKRIDHLLQGILPATENKGD